MKRVYSIALAFALLFSGCAKTVEVENTDEVPVVSEKAEETIDEYIVSSPSTVETLPYDPEAEWNYVPLD